MRNRMRNVLVERLDVDVAGTVAQRLADDAVDQLDDRRLVVEVDLVGLVGALDLAVGRLERRRRGVRCRRRNARSAR